MKDELRAAEEELAAAEAARDEALAARPEPAARLGARRRHRGRRRRDPPLRRAARARRDAKEASEIGRFELERAARLSGSRFGYIVGDTALLALSLYRFALDHVVAARASRRCCRPCSSARRRWSAPASSRPRSRTSTRSRRTASSSPGTSEVALAALHMDGDPRGRRAAAPLRRRSRPASAARPARRARTRAGCSACTSSTRSRCSSSRRPADAWAEHDRMVALEEDLAHAARSPVPRRQRRGRRPRRAGREEDRHRGVVPVAGALPRGDVVLEHDRLPGAPARDPLPRRRPASRRRTR